MTKTQTTTDFTTFGEMLHYLRRRARMTQRDLGLATGYSEAQIARLEGGSRLPDIVIVRGVFVEALDLKNEPLLAAQLITLAEQTRHAHEPSEPDDDTHPATSHSRNNLPIQLTRFIGRENDIAAGKELVKGTRLLTLMGSGGAGKTRLALEVARDLANAYPDGVILVEFAPISDPELVPELVLRAFNLPPTNRQPLSALSEYLKHKHLLLLLDNCEHLIAACAEFAEALLRSCPNVHLLATSREPLGIPGEKTWRVPEMDINDALQLFAERAQEKKFDFVLNERSTPLVQQLCERLDRMPLAIELAAARMGAMKLEDIAARLDDRFRLLTGGARTVLPRQQTLRATIEWSYNLLSEPERKVLQRLSVFAGGASTEAAEAVCADNYTVLQADVLSLLVELWSKSLVIVDESGEHTRYYLLESVRQFASEKLNEAGNEEHDYLLRCHLNFYIELVNRDYLVSKSVWGRKKQWLDLLETEYGNLRVAMAEVQRQDDLVAAFELFNILQAYWSNRGYVGEDLEWVRRAILQKADANSSIYAWVLESIGWLEIRKGDLVQARELLIQAHSVAFQLEDESLILSIDIGLSIVSHTYDQAITYINEALSIAKKVEYDTHHWEEALYTCMGSRELIHGNLEEAKKWLDKALITPAGTKPKNSWAFKLRGFIEFELGNFDAASIFYQSSLANAREQGDNINAADALVEIATVALAQGRVLESKQSMLKAIQIYHWIGNDERVAQCLSVSSGIAQSQSQPDIAVSLLASTSHVRYGLRPNEDFHIGFYKDFDRRLDLLRTEVDTTTFDRAWSKGQSMTLDQAVEIALRL